MYTGNYSINAEKYRELLIKLQDARSRYERISIHRSNSILLSPTISVNRLQRDGSNDLNKGRVRHGPGSLSVDRARRNDAIAFAQSVAFLFFSFSSFFSRS